MIRQFTVSFCVFNDNFPLNFITYIFLLSKYPQSRVCFGTNVRKISIHSIHMCTPVLLYKNLGYDGYILHGHVFLMGRGVKYVSKRSFDELHVGI